MPWLPITYPRPEKREEERFIHTNISEEFVLCTSFQGTLPRLGLKV